MQRLSALCGIAVAACSSSPAPYEPVPEPPRPQTEAKLAGSLCKDRVCTCRGGDPEAPGVPDEGSGLKRYEFHLGPSDNEMWATVDEMVLFKSREHAEDCFYVDLAPGSHKVTLRARGDNGFGARMAISEQGAKGPWWYSTFEFVCGAPGLCDRDTLDAWKKKITAYKEKHDPCGSTKILGVGWQHGRMPDNIHPNDLLLELTLKVYKFVPDKPPGDANCGDPANQ